MKYVMTAVLVAAATTLGVSPAAQAAPDKCTWTPNGNHSTFHQNNNLDIQIDWGPGAQGGTASYAGLEYMDWKGPVQGGVEPGTNKVDFTVPWQLASFGYGPKARPDEPAPTNHYTGTISDAGRASGTTVNDSNASNTWTDNATWSCAAWGFGPTQP